MGNRKGELLSDVLERLSLPFHQQRHEIQTARLVEIERLKVRDEYEAYKAAKAGAATKSSISQEIDPSDLPPELDAANLAFRAVANGYGDQTATPKERLIAFLEQNYPDFNSKQIQRIATVANPDKSTGRKRYGDK